MFYYVNYCLYLERKKELCKYFNFVSSIRVNLDIRIIRLVVKFIDIF